MLVFLFIFVASLALLASCVFQHIDDFAKEAFLSQGRFFYGFLPTSTPTVNQNRSFSFFTYMGYARASNVLTATTCDLPTSKDGLVAANAFKGYAGKKRMGLKAEKLIAKFLPPETISVF